jgi:hypothetical protein
MVTLAAPITLTVEFPLRITNPLNGSQGNRWGKSRDRKKQRALTTLVLMAELREIEGIGAVDGVTFTRIGPRDLDDDGLAAACKSIRDATAEFLGVSDAPRGGVRWAYQQERGPKVKRGVPPYYGVRIEITIGGAP